MVKVKKRATRKQKLFGQAGKTCTKEGFKPGTKQFGTCVRNEFAELKRKAGIK